MLIDTHCHLTMMKTYKTTADKHHFATDIESIIQDAAKENVIKIIDVGTTIAESVHAVQYACIHEHVYAAIGIHPCDISADWRADMRSLQQLLETTPPGRIVAIGECGIDLYHQPADLQLQQDVFKAHIELALSYQLPLIIHSRDAAHETLACLDAYTHTPLRGVMHCFSYDMAIARDVIARKFVMGIGGTATYPKNHTLREVVCSLPLSSFVLETDAPFLPPQPWRGQQNHPQYLRYIAQYIAEQRNEPFDLITSTTTKTALQLFQLSCR
jgi:TatD DNase family protein